MIISHDDKTTQPSPAAGAASVFGKLEGWEQCHDAHLQSPVDEHALRHRDIRDDEFWRSIPAYRDIDRETFLDHSWQARNSVTNPQRLRKALGELVPEDFYHDVSAGYRRAPMSMRVSPYLMSLIDWSDPYACPLRKQFIPAGQQWLPDHPQLDLDSLHEQADSPVPGLTHRYADKALFLPLDTCPVYCRFCTRSYSIGVDTESVEKAALRVDYNRWRRAFAYLAARPEIEDVVISGGDSYNLRPEQILGIGHTLLGMKNIRRIRFATKGLAIMPQKVLTHHDWLEAIDEVAKRGRAMHKEVVIHTHFNHPSEITWISQAALGVLHERGLTIRNQAVLLRGVNDSIETMGTLVRRLGYVNVQPYYVYLCDMVKGVEDLRTSVATAVEIEKGVRGQTAGFNTPTFVCDTPGGGGKRCVHSYEHYNRTTGIAVYTAPSVKPGKFFVYCDPLHSLGEASKARWQEPQQQQAMVDDAIAEARAHLAL